MSYCELIMFRNGEPSDSIEFRNAWGGAARIWTSLFDTYMKDPSKGFDNWLSRCCNPQDRSLWDLAKRKDLPMFERAVHAATFDSAIVRNEHFKQFANHLREFVAKYPVEGKVCHLSSWADEIESCDAEAVGFYGTSVAENTWYEFDDEKDESVPYNLNTGDKHFEVYDWLAELDTNQGK